jgi:xanthine dehydrogenase accessory factor
METAVTALTHPDQAGAIREAADRVRAGQAAALPIRVQTDDGLVEYRVRIEESPKLVIAGAGHVGQAMAAAAVPIGFNTTVIDDRADFANPERFPPPINILVSDIEKTLETWPIDPNTYVVIVTRGHKHDERALRAVLGSSAKYLGMIGSGRKITVLFKNLKEGGIPAEQLDRVHAPIGLEIHAVTPEEIAVAIAAQLIAVRREGQQKKNVDGPFPVPDATP